MDTLIYHDFNRKCYIYDVVSTEILFVKSDTSSVFKVICLVDLLTTISDVLTGKQKNGSFQESVASFIIPSDQLNALVMAVLAGTFEATRAVIIIAVTVGFV
jgi:hypothetical protein